MSNFTDTYIKALKPANKRQEIYEGGGFGIRITPTGTKTWIYRYKINGKTDKITLGHYPTMSLASAKTKFLEYSQQRKDGKAPKVTIEEQRQKETNTVKKLVMEWYTNYAEKNRKRPLAIKQQIDADIIPTLGNISLDKIETMDITKSLDKILARGSKVHANRVLSTIKQAFKYGKNRGYFKHNPDQTPAISLRARDVGGPEKSRDRVLSMNEIKKIWHYIDNDGRQMSPQTKCALKFLLLTGVRTSELRLATWDQFNIDESLWTIPKKNTKTDVIHKIHLSSQVKALFDELREIRTSQYIIAGAVDDEPMTENVLARAVRRTHKFIGIPHWTVHDLRRTFSTHLDETLHVNPIVIEKCLAHRMPKIMAVYNKSEMLPERRDALNQWGQYIEHVVCNDNVLTLKKTA